MEGQRVDIPPRLAPVCASEQPKRRREKRGLPSEGLRCGKAAAGPTPPGTPLRRLGRPGVRVGLAGGGARQAGAGRSGPAKAPGQASSLAEPSGAHSRRGPANVWGHACPSLSHVPGMSGHALAPVRQLHSLPEPGPSDAGLPNSVAAARAGGSVRDAGPARPARGTPPHCPAWQAVGLGRGGPGQCAGHVSLILLPR